MSLDMKVRAPRFKNMPPGLAYWTWRKGQDSTTYRKEVLCLGFFTLSSNFNLLFKFRSIQIQCQHTKLPVSLLPLTSISFCYERIMKGERRNRRARKRRRNTERVLHAEWAAQWEFKVSCDMLWWNAMLLKLVEHQAPWKSIYKAVDMRCAQ